MGGYIGRCIDYEGYRGIGLEAYSIKGLMVIGSGYHLLQAQKNPPAEAGGKQVKGYCKNVIKNKLEDSSSLCYSNLPLGCGY
jgi:hypothetical protein